jgi:hypothetical protein
MKVIRIAWLQLFAAIGLIILLVLVIFNKVLVPQSRFSTPAVDASLPGFVTRSLGRN